MLILKFLSHLYQGQAEALKVPLFGDITDHKKLKPKSKIFKEATFITAEENKTVSFQKTCVCCGKNNHELDACYHFIGKTMNEKQDFVKAKKLCFACLKPNHRSKDCRRKLTCKKCKRFHPTALHREGTVAVSATQSTSPLSTGGESEQVLRSSCTGKVACPCVPVGIKIKGKKQMIVTNMAMDTHATSCYMDESLLQQLNIKGEDDYLTLTTMEQNSSKIPVKIIADLEIVSLDNDYKVTIPKVFAKKHWPFENHQTLSEKDVNKFPELNEVPFNFVKAKVGLLVGLNMPEILRPLEIINTSKNGPYASKHVFGWALNGPIGGKFENVCFRTCIKTDYQSLDNKIESYFARDFEDKYDDMTVSRQDLLWQEKVSSGIKQLPNGQYEIPLPFEEDDVTMPDNERYCLARLNSLKTQLRNDKFRGDYISFMKEMREKNFVEEVPPPELETAEGKKWFLPHHGVYHKQIKSIRVVFDCSSKYKGISLNDKLLQGPDLTNNLVGVLLRFRNGEIAFTSDIQKMFYSIKVSKEDTNFLRFFWYKNDDINSKPVQFRLNVHVFGAKSSPSCANFALQRCILGEGSGEANPDSVRSTMVRLFYVDDMLAVVNTEAEAVSLLSAACSTLTECGFNLTGFSSNSKNLLKTIPNDKMSKNLKGCNDLDKNLPDEKTLGLTWNPNSDELCFDVKINQSLTKRGILSTIFSIYDPLFIVSPALVKAKTIFQKTCSLSLGWDDLLPKDLELSWKIWLEDIVNLKNCKIPRCYFNSQYDNLELHLFCDESETAYGSVAYLRSVSPNNVQCSITLAKLRLVPLKRGSLKTIPRIELNSAKLAVILYLQLVKELDLDFSNVYFWTDSTIVLSYIRSKDRKFQRFVSNRIAFIHSHTSESMWKFVPCELNPADF